MTVVYSRSQRIRSLTVVIISAGMVGLTAGYTVPLLALMLEAQGYSQWEVGVNGAAPALATILLGPLVPRLFSRFGLFPTIIASAMGSAVAIVCLALFPGLWTWFALRFIIGFCGTVQWIGSETWIVAISTPGRRGRAVAYYMILLSAGFAGGPVMIDWFGTQGWIPILAAAALILAMLPVLFIARDVPPQLPEEPPGGLLLAVRMAPLVMMAALLAGFTDTAALTHFAIYAERSGHPQSMAILMLSIMLASNMLLQLPIAWVAERVNRRRMLIFFGGIFFAAPLVIDAGIMTPGLLWPALCAWGAASLGIYTIALMILGDRFPPAMLSSANAAIVALYQVGAIIGQPAGGAGMDLFGPPGLMWVLSGAALVFLLFAAYRSFFVRRVDAT